MTHEETAIPVWVRCRGIPAVYKRGFTTLLESTNSNTNREVQCIPNEQAPQDNKLHLLVTSNSNSSSCTVNYRKPDGETNTLQTVEVRFEDGSTQSLVSSESKLHGLTGKCTDYHLLVVAH